MKRGEVDTGNWESGEAQLFTPYKLFHIEFPIHNFINQLCDPLRVSLSPRPRVSLRKYNQMWNSLLPHHPIPPSLS